VYTQMYAKRTRSTEFGGLLRGALGDHTPVNWKTILEWTWRLHSSGLGDRTQAPGERN